jgi:hypothetical protein
MDKTVGASSGGNAAGRDFMAGQLVQAETVVIQSHAARKLHKEERRILGEKVKAAAKICGIPAQQLWVSLHGYARVKSIEDMWESHLPALNAILDLMQENAALKRQLPDEHEQKLIRRYRDCSEEGRHLLDALTLAASGYNAAMLQMREFADAGQPEKMA